MSKTLQRFANIVFAVLVATFSINLTGVMTLNTANAAKAIYDTPTNGKITICHRTNSVSNPYSQITVDVDAADGISGNSGHSADHYGEHKGPVFDVNTTYPTPHNGDQWGDIIPPVVPNSQVPGANTAGLNWNGVGQAIYYNGCNIPVQDASAGVSVTQPTCDSNGVASVTGLVNAVLTSNNGVLDQTVGTHTAVFTATVGHVFANQTGTLSVSYTIAAQLVCTVNDATATVTPTAATCDKDGGASFAVNHATLTSNGGILDQTPGTHIATFTADAGHAFAGGAATLEIEYTIDAQLTGEQCAGEQPNDDHETRKQSKTVCLPNGGGTVTSWQEERSRSYSFDEETNSWVAGDWSDWTVAEGSETSRPATDQECPPVCVPSTVTLRELTLLNTNVPKNDCTPGQGGAGGETPSTPSTPVVTELPETGPADSNTALKLATIIIAGIATYGAMYVAVNRRSLLQK